VADRTSKAERVARSVGALWSKRDVAAAFGVTPRTVTTWISQGVIPAPDVAINQRVKRWKSESIRRLIDGD